MKGPYDWVPPIYWETDSNKLGGAWSFATEISPGPSIPPYESLIKFIDKDSLSYSNGDWLYHCGTMTFGNTHIFDSALNERYGISSTFHEYVAKAQAQNYEAHRAMMEAYGLNKYNTATGVVQWMLSNPWPSLIWHTYDYYLYPAGTYFGMKKSMEPLHVMYSYQSNEIAIINSLLTKFTKLQVKAQVYDLDGTLKYSRSVTTDVDEDGIKRCFALPASEALPDTYFLRLQLKDGQGKVKSINWYWLSKKKDELNWKNSRWYYTPQSSFTDYRALQNLNKTKLNLAYTGVKKADSSFYTVTVTNAGKAVAFFVHMRALRSRSGDDILPVIFEDNYLVLAPGESRRIRCSYANKDAKNIIAPFFLTTAWNLDVKNSISMKGGGFAEEMPGK
jgi:exo-1,4-beta-D-glucosaminidase